MLKVGHDLLRVKAYPNVDVSEIEQIAPAIDSKAQRGLEYRRVPVQDLSGYSHKSLSIIGQRNTPSAHVL